MSEYEINEDTLALISLDEKTKVFEKGKSFVVNKQVFEIMEDSCEYFGSSLSGRQKGTEKLIGVSYKAPIIVEESKNIIFFPTASPRLKNCSWISLNNLERYYSKNKKLVLEFKNKQKIMINTSYGIIDNQILRATRLESVLRGRKNQKKL
ncbi:MAG: competence protein [Firmicutes bacterium]|nr:competence protein [Bacillota bacterium]